MNAAKNSKLAGFSDAKFAFDSAGLPVDCSGQVWILNCASRSKKIDWKTFPVKSDGILAASQQFMRHMIESQSPASVRNAFSALTLLFRSSEFQSADAGDTTLQYVMFSELKANLGKQVYRLHYIRQWYGWCSNFGYPNFSPDVAFEADQMQFGGNDKGQAVLSADPDEGPLSDAELSSLLTAMRATLGNDKLSLHQQAALWLCVALGPNPMQMAMLTEEDFIEIPDGNELGFMHLQVPRIKKRDNEARSGFRVRSLTADIGQIVKALISQNAGAPSTSGPAGHRSRPIFRRNKPREDLLGGPLDHYAMHVSAGQFTELVTATIDLLGIISPRTGKPIKMNTRRLRYTFATRLVREGVSKLEIADLLDHTDTQNVQVYFDIKSDVVEHLDKAMAMALAPIAQAFMGTLVNTEAEAIRGGDPSSGIATVAGAPGRVEKLGNCGSFGFCGALAPISCYTCRSFQPWMDAPHGIILDDLLKERARKVQAGLDGRMVSIHDTTISAIAEVILRIDQAKVGLR